MSDEEKCARVIEKIVRRNHELSVENARLRKMLALALVGLWQRERVCILGDRIARGAWADEHKN